MYPTDIALSSSMRVENRVCIVTGGANGLGRAVVDHLMSLKAKVVAFDMAKNGCEELLANSNFLYCKTNVTDEASVKASFDQVISKFGKVHVLVNCAGIAPAHRTVSKDGEPHPLDIFKRVIDINLNGTFNTLRIAAALMSKQEALEDEKNTPERGVIINIASVAAFEGQIGQAAYSASKGGVVAMTLPLARELAKFGIRVLTIAPGVFNTDMFKTLPEKVTKSLTATIPFPARAGEPEEFARLVASIIDNAYLNGTVIRIDGSIRMSSL